MIFQYNFVLSLICKLGSKDTLIKHDFIKKNKSSNFNTSSTLILSLQIDFYEI